MNGHLNYGVLEIRYSNPLSSNSVGLLSFAIVMNGSFISLDSQLTFIIFHISILFVDTIQIPVFSIQIYYFQPLRYFLVCESKANMNDWSFISVTES